MDKALESVWLLLRAFFSSARKSYCWDMLMFSLILGPDATTKENFEAVPEDVPKGEKDATKLRILDLR